MPNWVSSSRVSRAPSHMPVTSSLYPPLLTALGRLGASLHHLTHRRRGPQHNMAICTYYPQGKCRFGGKQRTHRPRLHAHVIQIDVITSTFPASRATAIPVEVAAVVVLVAAPITIASTLSLMAIAIALLRILRQVSLLRVRKNTLVPLMTLALVLSPAALKPHRNNNSQATVIKSPQQHSA